MEKPQLALWDAVTAVHPQVDCVLAIEKELTTSFSPDQKYSYEERNNLTFRVYSPEFTKA